MSEDVKQSNSWEAVINNFFEQKKTKDETTYLKEEIKKIKAHYEKVSYLHDQELEIFFDAKKNKKSKGQEDIIFQRIKALKIVRFPTKLKLESYNHQELISNYRLKLKQLNNKYSPQTWLDENSTNALNVSFATHVIKLTHSKIDSPSLYDQIDHQKPTSLTTSSLNEKTIDGAVSGNQFAPIFQFLELEVDGQKLATNFNDTNNVILECFSKNNKQLSTWNEGFNKALSTKEKSSHFLAKQIYFPINYTSILKASSYHLLCNVKSSSLAHAIFENVFNDKQKEPRDLKEKNMFSKVATVSFVSKAKLSVTASNHSNASQLNGKRGGKIFLFSTQPPTWKSQLKPPLYKNSLFDNISNSHITEDIDYLREFLLRFDRIELSIKDPKRLKWIHQWANSIVDEVLFYTASIQNLPSGWSATENIKLKAEHQYFLDPYRDEKSFQDRSESTDWQKIVCSDFARWLNRRLVGREKQFTPQAEHSRIWQQLFGQPLRENSETIKAELKQHKQEAKA